MSLAAHVVFGTYGFWLPNDPRGSGSSYVGSRAIYDAGGPATTLHDRRQSVAHSPHDHEKRLATKAALKYPAVRFDRLQACPVGRGFANYATHAKLTIWACSILSDHVHLVLARHELDYEQLCIQLKGAATRQLIREERHPFRELVPDGTRPPKCFGGGNWKVFLDSHAAINRAIEYVQRNPLKDGFRMQNWSFVTPQPAQFSTDTANRSRVHILTA